MSTPSAPVPRGSQGGPLIAQRGRGSLVHRAAAILLPLLALLPPATPHRRRDERGLSQSTENAILLVGAVSVATIVVTAVTAYVKSHLP